ncbi:MAG: hypothetical protein IH843_05175 [Thaumarchaeota archaeon]|nr:hypothetical protein [Nitrososphaerota archaeon]
MAMEWSKLSYCKRRQVGALIVKDNMIISDGYNGTPRGFENICEDDEGYTKAQSKALEKNEAMEIFKKARDSGISEYDGAQIEIWTESYSTVQNES